MQIQKQHLITTSLQRMCNRLHEHCDDWLGNVQWEMQDQQQVEEPAFYGCLSCGLRCKNKAGEAAHMFRVHGQQSIVRSLFDGTQCEACLKEFHTNGRIKAHLYYSHECRHQMKGGEQGALIWWLSDSQALLLYTLRIQIQHRIQIKVWLPSAKVEVLWLQIIDYIAYFKVLDTVG